MEQPLKLSRPNPKFLFTLQTDASPKGMGAVLFQEDENKKKYNIYI